MKTNVIKTLTISLSGLAIVIMASCGEQKKEKTAIESEIPVVERDSASEATIVGDTVSVSIVGKPEVGRGFILEVKKGGKKVQQLHYSYNFDDYGEPNIPLKKDSMLLRDVTSDGNKDLLIYMGSYGNQGIERFDCYVWDVKAEKLVHAPSFVNIDDPKVDKTEGCVFSSARSSAAEYVYGLWQYKDGKFKKTTELVEHYTAPGGEPVYAEKDSDGRVVKDNLGRSEISACWKALVQE